MARVYQLEVGQRFSFEGNVYVKAEKSSKSNPRGVIVLEETGEEAFLPTMTRVQVLHSKEEVEQQPDVIQTEDLPLE